MNTQRLLYNLSMAVDAVTDNKFRSFLTALGIIFGVGAVIAMLAIGKGEKKEIIDQMKYVGVNNIIITPKSDIDANQTEGSKTAKKKFSKGLTIADAQSFVDFIPTIAMVSPEVVYDVPVVSNGKSSNLQMTGVKSDFFNIFNINIAEGNFFTEEQAKNGAQVCIIGSNVKAKFFIDSSPIGQYIKCGNVNLKIIGIIEKMAMSASTGQDLGVSDYNDGIYAPIQTIMLRYKDRSVVTTANLSDNSSTTVVGGGGNYAVVSSSNKDKSISYNQLDKIVVHVKNTEDVTQTTDLIFKMLKRRHSNMEDFNIIVPEVLLKQEQRTKDIFNIVLGAIASISLIVGGIGIMNIMLASVIERTKEIGTRLAIGATKKDIIFQFLAEATIISLIGGILGIILGVVISKSITSITHILTIVSFGSVVISFGVSATIGICFGYMPAKKAANQNPVKSLRYE